MNAVTTAEYVVLEELAPTLLADKINHYSQLGYRLLHFAAISATDILDQYYNAVMVREPAPTYFTEWQARTTQWEEAFKKWDGTPAFNPEKHFEQIAMLQQKVQTLERQIESVALMLSKDDDLENRLHRLEDQMTDHLRTY